MRHTLVALGKGIVTFVLACLFCFRLSLSSLVREQILSESCQEAFLFAVIVVENSLFCRFVLMDSRRNDTGLGLQVLPPHFWPA